MSDQSRAFEVAIYRRNPGAGQYFYDEHVDVGSLLRAITDDSLRFVAPGEQGDVTVHVKRTHEWELVIGLALTGSGIFLASALKELGKHFGDWLAGRVGKLGTKANPEVRADGIGTVVVDPSDLPKAMDAIGKLLTDSAAKRIRVQIIVEP